MPVPYIQKQYFWLPRLWGQDPETGTYAFLPEGAWQFVSDQDPNTIPFNPPGLQQRGLHLPIWFPRQVYFNKIRLALSCAAGLIGNFNEVAVTIDPAGQFFKTGNPNGAEGGSNFTNNITLAQPVISGNDWRSEHLIDPPVLLDRDAGDLINVKLSVSQYCEWLFVGFCYLVANPHAGMP